MDEFGLIAKYFKPLTAKAPGALALTDDAAVLAVPDGEELVLTTDVIVAGVHFLDSDPLDLVAKKLIRVNVSDLAAKGARPVGYLLACCWPRRTREEDIAKFTRGLAEDQAVYGLSLLGGDTTSTGGPLTLSLTALGTVKHGGMVKRFGAKPGDLVFVTGTIGDAGLGLKIAKGEDIGATQTEASELLRRYRLPEPRLAFALAAHRLMFAAIDVSDGLIADAGHIAEVSGVRIKLIANEVPVGEAARAWLNRGGKIEALATAGDDYEICFTSPPSAVQALMAAAKSTGTGLTRIGEVEAGSGVALIGPNGREIALAKPGFTHF